MLRIKSVSILLLAVAVGICVLALVASNKNPLPRPPSSAQDVGTDADREEGQSSTGSPQRSLLVDVEIPEVENDKAAAQTQNGKGGVPPSESAQSVLRHMRRAGVTLPDEPRMSDSAAWSDLLTAWEQLSLPIRNVARQRNKMLNSIAVPRFESGDCEHHYYDAPSGQGVPEHLDVGASPDYHVVKQHGFDTAVGKKYIKIVRIRPGESPELDALNEKLERARQLRRDVATSFPIF